MNVDVDTNTDQQWIKSDIQTFWGEIAPSNHLVQIYENDDIIMASLEGFVSSGFQSGDSVIIIASANHLTLLNSRLKLKGFDIRALSASGQYTPLNAEETLARFMVVGWPDENRFNEVVTELLNLAKGKENRRVRAYGEMVAILWGQGYSGATVQLEHLWNKFCEKQEFCLFCAYPKSGFTQDVHTSIGHICSTHTKVISGEKRSETEVFYKAV
jgi:DcmR-like sensory protein